MRECKLVILGTGTARPTPRRGCSAAWLQFGGDAVLFDCGEGTQLKVLEAGLRTSKLQALCVTHFHGDHVNGLPGFIGTMGLNGHRAPVRLVGPRGLRKWLAVLRDLSILRPAFRLDIVEENEGVVAEWDDFSIEACPLDHRVPTGGYLFREHDLPGRFDVDRARALGVTPGPDFGRLQRGETVVLDGGRAVAPEQVMGPSRPGRKIAWITDTRPSDRVIEFVKGADLLVHEATYLHALHESAYERGHTTVQQAAEIAAAAEVKQLVLTHISPKHTRNRELLDEARPVFEAVRVAEDGMEFVVDVPA